MRIDHDLSWGLHPLETIIRQGIVIICCGLIGCSPAQVESTVKAAADKATADLPKVSTVKPERKTLIQKTDQPGQVEALHTTPLLAKVGGYVDRLLVDIGDHVKGPQRDAAGQILEEGQLLAELVAPELEEEFQQKVAMVLQVTAEVGQAAAAVNVARSMQASALANVEESQAGQTRAAAMHQRWKSEFDRVQELVASKSLSQKVADETQQQYKAADASRSEAAAKNRSALAKQQEAEVAIEKAQADLKVIEARRNVALADRDRVAALRHYLQIRAPYSGVITARNIDQGTLVLAARGGTDTPLFVLVQADTVRLFVDVPDTEAVLVEAGRPATVRVPALGAKIFTGAVTRTGWALQSGTRTLNCEIDVPNADGLLRPGMYARVELVVAQRENVWSVPKAAVVQVDGQTVVLAVTDANVIQRKPVQVGIRTLTDVEIVTGLEGTESLVSANAAAFKDGQNVARAK